MVFHAFFPFFSLLKSSVIPYQCYTYSFKIGGSRAGRGLAATSGRMSDGAGAGQGLAGARSGLAAAGGGVTERGQVRD